MKSVIFREYDIRGIIDDELVIQEVYNLARSVALYLCQHNKDFKTIAIGMDARPHSPLIKDELCRGFIDSGVNVVFIGVCTTPMAYFATHTLSVDGAVMITASHNPIEYNGLKICSATHALWGKDITEIQRLFQEQQYRVSHTKGSYSQHDIKAAYLTWHLDRFAFLKDMNISAVIDCGSGTAGIIVPELVSLMKWKDIQLLCADVDMKSASHSADPTKISNMRDVQDTLKKSDADIGIGFDGDADRMGVMTKEGRLVEGDKLLAVFAHAMIQKHPGMTVVCNVLCSSGLSDLINQWGGSVVVTPVGHAIIKEAMDTHHALLAGEISCHFFFKDDHFGYDDGLYAMLRLFSVLYYSGNSLEELLKIFPKKITSLEYRIVCAEELKHVIVNELKGIFFQNKNYSLMTIDGVKVMNNHGWGIIRASNTQPALSIRFEADSLDDLHNIKKDFIAALSVYFDSEYLQEQFK